MNKKAQVDPEMSSDELTEDGKKTVSEIFANPIG